MFLESYHQAKTRLLRAIDETKTILTAKNLTQGVKNIESLAERLNDNRFNIVVLGQMKRGKSTFVNALLRSPDMLPSGVIPVSSAIVSIEYGEKESCEVFFKNGKAERIPHRRISEYCDEAKNPINEKGVKNIKVSNPSEWLKAGVTLFDTPGEGSIESYHSELIYQVIPQADAILYLFSSDVVIGKAEYDFLEKIAEYGIEKIIFVLNKVDRFSIAEITESKTYNQKILRKINGFEKFAEEEILPVSSKRAIEDIRIQGHPQPESGFTELEKYLTKLINQERAAVFIGGACTALGRGVHEGLKSIAAEQSALTCEDEEITKKINGLREERHRINKNLEEYIYSFDAAMNEAKRDFRKNLKEVEKSLNRWTKRRLDEGSILTLNRMVKDLEGQMKERLVKDVQDIAHHVIEEFIPPAIEKLERGVKNELNSLNSTAESIDLPELGQVPETLTAGTIAPGAVLAVGGASLVLYGSALSAASSPIWTFIAGESLLAATLGPVGWALLAIGGIVSAGLILKKAIKGKDKIQENVEAAIKEVIGKCEADFNERTDAFRNELHIGVNALFNEKIEPVEKALESARKAKSEDSLQVQILFLNQQQSELERIGKEIEVIRNTKL